MRKKQKLEFKTKRNTEIAKKKKFFLIFLIALLVFGTASTLVLLRTVDFNLANLFTGREEETTAAQTTAPVTAVPAGSANFLVFCVSDDAKDKGHMRFIAVINADLSNMRIRVCAVKPMTPANVDGRILTLEEHFIEGGADRLRKAVENFSGIAIDRFAYTNDTGFKNAVKSIDKSGSLTLHIGQTINYKDSLFNLFIPAGDKAVNSDTLLKYFRYNGTQGDPGVDEQAQTLRSMLDQYITKANAENSEKLFEQLFNAMSLTDIKASDFQNAKTAIDLLAASKASLTISVESNLSLFTGSDAETAKEETTS